MARLTNHDIEELGALCLNGSSQNVNLAQISNWRIGGMADCIIRPSSTVEVAAVLAWCNDRGIRPMIIGSTSNLLFCDKGIHVPLIQVSDSLSSVFIENGDVFAQAGIWVPILARKLMQVGLSGAEHACGIPGTLGGLVCMNGGSQRKSIASNICEVESVAADGTILVRKGVDCDFGYRKSIFQDVQEVVTGVRLRFDHRTKQKIRREMREILCQRRRKFPRKLPNCGSVFVSDPSTYEKHGPPGAIIEKLGFKGVRRGGAQVSPQHANFIVNTGGATSADVVALIRDISHAAHRELSVSLSAEVRYVSADGISYPATEIPFEFSEPMV